jgi:hypothetical protein
MRHAVIKDGKVVDVVLVGWNYAMAENHPGHQVVASETANVGDSFDGTSFKRETPPQRELVFHAQRRNAEIPKALYRAGSVVVSVAVGDHGVIARLAERAAKDSNLTVQWGQPDSGDSVFLNAAQIIALNEAITDSYLMRAKAFAGVLHAIKFGQVTNHGHVDNPPAPLPQWPPRLDEPPA